MATTAWIFSYKLKKNVSEEQFIERTKSYTMRSSPKRKDLSPGNIIYRIKCGLTLFFGKRRKMHITRQRWDKEKKLLKIFMLVFK